MRRRPPCGGGREGAADGRAAEARMGVRGWGIGVVAVLAAGAALAAPGRSRVTRTAFPFDTWLDVASGNNSQSALAVAPDGTIHVMYTGPGHEVRHAWREDGLWRTEHVADGPGMWGASSLVLDGAGRLHATWSDGPYPGPSMATWHGVRHAGVWAVTTVGPGSGAVLFLGGDGGPRIALHSEGALRLASRVDGAWVMEDLGPDDARYAHAREVRVDAAGALHLLADAWPWGGGFHATDRSGAWVVDDQRVETLALDAEGRPHGMIQGPGGGEGGGDRLLHRWHDGSEWRTEDVLPWGRPWRFRGYPRLQADGAGRLFATFYQYENLGDWRTHSARLAWRDALGWRDLHLARLGGALPYPPVLGPDGTVHVTWLSGPHVKVAFQDLRVDVAGLAVRPRDEDGALAEGVVRVVNDGAGRARGTWLRFLLSEDDFPDEGDRQIGPVLRVPPVRRRAEHVVPVRVRAPEGAPGSRILAVVEPSDGDFDLDRGNDVGVVALDR